MWSLAVEEQFYLVWPLLIAVVVAVSRGRPIPPGASGPRLARRVERRHSMQTRRLAVALIVLCLASFAWSLHDTTANPTSAYYSTLTRAWELGLGALLALSLTRVTRWPTAVKLLASWAGLIMIVWAALRYSPTTPYPGSAAALPVIGAALVLVGGTAGPHGGARLLLDTAPMRFFGDISYSLYLWHWPVLLLPQLYLARNLTLPERFALMGLSVLLAWLSYRLVETPARRAPALTRTPRRSLVLWPASIAIVVAAVLWTDVRLPSDTPAAVASSDSASLALDRLGDPSTPFDDPALRMVAEAVGLARRDAPLPDHLSPTLDQLDHDVSVLPIGCGRERDDTDVKTCSFGDPHATRTMVLMGDSHSIMWMPALARLAEIQGWRLVALQKASCFPADTLLWRQDKNRPYDECRTWLNKAYDVVATLKPQRIVISGVAWPLVVNPGTGQPATNSARRPLLAQGMASTLHRLTAITPHVAVIGGTPNLKQSAGDCLGTKRATRATCAVHLDDSLLALNGDWAQAAKDVGASFVDPVPWLCAERLCPLVIGDVIAYRDTNHLTRTFARTLLVQLQRRIRL
jgi:hypothetical protein